MVQKLLLVLTLALQACSTKEFIVDSERTQEAVGGFVKNAPFSLGKPNTFSQGVLEDWQKMGIYVSFDDHAKLHKVSVYQGTRFATSLGIKIGDGIEKVEQVYGRPKQKKLDFGESNNVHWVWNALVYKNLIFYVDTTTNKVSSFSIGNVWVLP